MKKTILTYYPHIPFLLFDTKKQEMKNYKKFSSSCFLFNDIQLFINFGGGEGNRTPVQK